MTTQYEPHNIFYDFADRFLPFLCFRRVANFRSFYKSTIDQMAEGITYGAGTEFGENVCIEPNVIIGKNCYIGTNTVIRNNTVIGDNSVIGHLVLIEKDVQIGENSTVQSQCSITQGTVIGDNVFLGPCVVCANDKKMVKYHPERGEFICQAPIFKDGCSVGAASHILPGVVIGENAVVGMGSTVTKDIPANQKWYGHRAVFRSVK